MRRTVFGAAPTGKRPPMSRWRPHDRRVGPRVQINGAQLSWTPALEHKRFRRADSALVATVLDLSLGGARVRAPYDPRIVVGTQIRVGAGGSSGLAEVRRIKADDNPNEAIYGIRFVRLDSSLFDLFNDTLAARRSQDSDGAA